MPWVLRVGWGGPRDTGPRGVPGPSGQPEVSSPLGVVADGGQAPLRPTHPCRDLLRTSPHRASVSAPHSPLRAELLTQMPREFQVLIPSSSLVALPTWHSPATGETSHSELASGPLHGPLLTRKLPCLASSLLSALLCRVLCLHIAFTIHRALTSLAASGPCVFIVPYPLPPVSLLTPQHPHHPTVWVLSFGFLSVFTLNFHESRGVDSLTLCAWRLFWVCMNVCPCPLEPSPRALQAWGGKSQVSCCRGRSDGEKGLFRAGVWRGRLRRVWAAVGPRTCRSVWGVSWPG